MSVHFTVKEFECKDGTDYPAEWLTERWAVLVAELEIIRAEVRAKLKPDAVVVVNSGYRSPKYNRKIGGARSSQHTEGRAADIKVPGVDAAKVHDLVLTLVKEGKLKHVKGLGKYPSFTHVDVRVCPGKCTRLHRWSGSRAEN